MNILLDRDKNEGFKKIGFGAEFSVRGNHTETCGVTMLLEETYDFTQFYSVKLMRIGEVWESRDGYREVRKVLD